MSYRIGRDESVSAAVRRIAHERIDKAVKEVESDKFDPHEKVHQVRKRCKELRGLIRLVRPAFEKTYQRTNIAFRDIARPLSDPRDARTVIDSYDDLMEHFAEQINRESFGIVRRRLTARLHEFSDADVVERLSGARDALLTVKGLVDDWRFKSDDFDAIAAGVAKTRQRAVKDLQQVERDADTDTLHDWRKRLKYHWFHLRLLQGIWPENLKSMQTQIKQLVDYLGEDHDLANFLFTVETFASEIDSADLEALRGLVQQRRKNLQRRTIRLGQRALAESTESLNARFKAYWKLWRADSSER